MLIIIFSFILSVFGVAAIVLDCHMPHGTPLRIIPGIAGITCLIIIVFMLKKKKLHRKNTLLVIFVIFLAVIDLIGFADWAVWATNLRPDNILLNKAMLQVEIEGFKNPDLYELDNDWYLLVVRQGERIEEYHVYPEQCIISFIPSLRTEATSANTIKVDKSILSGRKFVFDIDVICNKTNNGFIIEVNQVSEPDYFANTPLLLHKELVFITKPQ